MLSKHGAVNFEVDALQRQNETLCISRSANAGASSSNMLYAERLCCWEPPSIENHNGGKQ